VDAQADDDQRRALRHDELKSSRATRWGAGQGDRAGADALENVRQALLPAVGQFQELAGALARLTS